MTWGGGGGWTGGGGGGVKWVNSSPGLMEINSPGYSGGGFKRMVGVRRRE